MLLGAAINLENENSQVFKAVLPCGSCAEHPCSTSQHLLRDSLGLLKKTTLDFTTQGLCLGLITCKLTNHVVS